MSVFVFTCANSYASAFASVSSQNQAFVFFEPFGSTFVFQKRSANYSPQLLEVFGKIGLDLGKNHSACRRINTFPASRVSYNGKGESASREQTTVHNSIVHIVAVKETFSINMYFKKLLTTDFFLNCTAKS